MKTLLSVLVVLAVACPLHADYVVVQENFDGTAGTAVDGWNGWTLNNGTTGQIAISSTTVDQGNSAVWTSGSWPSVTKSFTPYTPAAGEAFVWTATLSTGTDNSGYSDLRLKNSTTGNFLQMCMGLGSNVYVNLNGSGNDGEFVKCGPRAPQEDMKVIITNSSAQAFTRAHGATTWDEMGKFSLGAGFSLSGYDTFVLFGHQNGGGIDSIGLNAAAVPEPTTAILFGTGVVGLLAYAWRKRK